MISKTFYIQIVKDDEVIYSVSLEAKEFNPMNAVAVEARREVAKFMYDNYKHTSVLEIGRVFGMTHVRLGEGIFQW